VKDYTRWNAYISRDTSLYRNEATEVFAEFDALSDYIFKSPRFLAAEEKIEKEKLDAYFPPDDLSETNQRYRARRAELEFGNIYLRFPIFQRTSNLLIATSLFEHHLTKLMRLEADRASRNVRSGAGVVEALTHIGDWSETFNQEEMLAPVQAIIKIRNRLVHSGGRLSDGAKCREARQIIAEKTYASPWHREHWAENFPELQPISITSQSDGDWIRLSENFPHLVCGYFRELHFGACVALDPL
jgi:hypothetical protein